MRGGPYAPTNWPPTIDPTKIVHYFVVDGTLAPDPGWTNWTQTLGFASGGDQVVTDTTVCTADVSYTGKKSTSSPGYMNVFDTDWTKWNTNDTIDILVQTYGDVSVFRNNNPANPVRTWRATLGTPAVQQQITFTGAFDTNAFNNRWNWILFRCANNFDPTGINRYCGRATSGTYGGINGGTIRLNAATAQGFLTGVNIHAIAFGEQGAFGEPADINLFDTPIVEVCDPMPNENLVGIDFNAGVTNYLQVMNDLDQTVTYTTSAGPAGDLRKAVIPVGSYLNFGILSNRLGQPCDPKVAMKVCVDFYDDPAFEGQGVQFGPEAYAVGLVRAERLVSVERAARDARLGSMGAPVVDDRRRQPLRGQRDAADGWAAIHLHRRPGGRLAVGDGRSAHERSFGGPRPAGGLPCGPAGLRGRLQQLR